MKTCTCPGCGAVYRAKSGGHCRDSCHRTFAGDSAASAHRKGPYHPEGQRYCVDFDNDLDAKGAAVVWRQNRYGEWTNSPEFVDMPWER